MGLNLSRSLKKSKKKVPVICSPFDHFNSNDNNSKFRKFESNQNENFECDTKNYRNFLHNNSNNDSSYYGICSDISFELSQLEWKFNDNSTINSKRIISADDFKKKYSFITSENTFYVQLRKGPRGLGLCICGGTDSHYSFGGLIRIKHLFPYETKFVSGHLEIGDLILAVNEKPLVGLKNAEALDLLSEPENIVTLTVCRLDDESHEILVELKTEYQEQFTSSLLNSDEYEVSLKKIDGSLGFTLQRGLTNGHYIRALVKEPAISNPFLKPGDRILLVNNTDISYFSHDDAVRFLRMCEHQVHLRLRRNDENLIIDLTKTATASAAETETDVVNVTTGAAAQAATSTIVPATVFEQATSSVLPIARNSTVMSSFCVSDSNSDALKRNDFKSGHFSNANFRELFNFVENSTNQNECMACDSTKTTKVNTIVKKSSKKSDSNFDQKIETLFSRNADLVAMSTIEPIREKYLFLDIELYRGWNSRLGFSLYEKNGATYVKHVYKNTFAGRDGKIQKEDCIVKINGENVGYLGVKDVICLLRFVQGPVCVTICRENV